MWEWGKEEESRAGRKTDVRKVARGKRDGRGLALGGEEIEIERQKGRDRGRGRAMGGWGKEWGKGV